jgi:hypothetical protein
MSQHIDAPVKSFQASAAITQYALVQLANSGKVSANGLATRPIGVAMEAAFADGDWIPVKLLPGLGTFRGIAKEAFAIAAVLYTEAGGKIQDTAETTSLPIGIALEAATAENDVIEWMPLTYGGDVAV